MLKYLIIMLSDDSTSFCHYDAAGKSGRLISIANLEKGILFALKHNLSIQFIYPSFDIPEEYKNIISSVPSFKIKPYEANDIEEADAIVINNIKEIEGKDIYKNTYILRTRIADIEGALHFYLKNLENIKRLNLVLTSIESVTEGDMALYKKNLSGASQDLLKRMIQGQNIQLNILTDRIVLTGMNNCNAGVESITLASDGNYYICPGFYIDNLETPLDESIRGVNIPNQYLYEIANSPICRKCDAWHCRRCVYLNKKTTLEVNSPSHEQCVISHIERNCSKQLLDNIKKVVRDYLPETEIEEIDYLDPFDKL